MCTAAAEPNYMLGCLGKSVASGSREVVCLSLSPVRPHLEHWVQFRAPQYEKDIATLEGVQWRAPE